MNLSPLAAGLMFGALIGTSSPVQAQFRPRSAPNRPRGGNPLNEQTKIQAEQAQQRGDYQKAIELTSSVLRYNARDDVALYIRASARVEFGIAKGDATLVRSGIADARQAIAIQRKNVNYYLPYLYGMTNLAGLENKPNHAEVSIQVADKAIAGAGIKPDEKANLLYQRALAHRVVRKFDAAARDFSAAVRLNPKHLGAHMGLPDAYDAAGQAQKALESFVAAEKLFPTNPLIYNNRGMFLQRRQRSDEAIADFTRAIELDANYFVAYTNRGFATMEKGDPEGAENDFSASLRIRADQPLVHSLRGTSRLAQGKVEAAIDDYQKVVMLDNRNPIARADLGFAQYFGKHFEPAISAFQQAVALDPQLQYTDPWRASAMIWLGRKSAAQQQFRAAQNKEAGNRNWVDHLIVYLLGGINEDELLSKVSKSDQQLQAAQLCEAHYFIGQLNAKSGRSQQADAHFQKALDTQAKHLSAYRGAKFALQRVAAAD